jgi:hypothetical protein
LSAKELETRRRKSIANNFFVSFNHKAQRNLAIYGILMTILLLCGSVYIFIIGQLEYTITAYDFYVRLNVMNNMFSGASPYLMVVMSAVIRKRVIDWVQSFKARLLFRK